MLQVVQRTAVISARVEQAMREGRIPWRGDHGFPTNAVSLRRYDGVNALLLNFGAERHGFRSPYWATWSQWLALGGEVRPRPAGVRPGEWSTEVVLERADGRLGRWALFNLEQVDGVPAGLRREVPAVPTAEVDRLIRATRATIRFQPGMEAASYYPPADHVVFPLRRQFLDGPGGLPAFYNSLLHELVHEDEPPQLPRQVDFQDEEGPRLGLPDRGRRRPGGGLPSLLHRGREATPQSPWRIVLRQVRMARRPG